MKKPVQLKIERKRGQVMVEYMVVLFSLLVLYFVARYVLLGAFIAYGDRALDLVIWKYP